MKPSALSSLSVLTLFIGTLNLVGCGGAFSMPDGAVADSTTTVAGPAIQGSVYGGHAPIQGAHLYLLQPGITGYGSVATSLLGTGTSTSPGGYTLSTDVNDPNVTVGAKYVTTDSNGGFNLTGAYACVVGQPVYIYSYGGNIGMTTSNIKITNASVVFNPQPPNPNYYDYTFTYTQTTGNPPVVGQTVNLSLTNTPPGGTGWNSLTSVTVATVSATQFTATGSQLTIYNGTGTGSYTSTVNNNSIVELATLGNCPSSGNFFTSGNGGLSYIYLNEVSTVATAYTFQPFTTTANNDAFHIGSSGTTQALLGIANAASTAAQLYNIQGGTQLSSSGDGEGHLANYLTAGGNGIVPQATIDSLANILANCVDAVPTAAGAVPTQCSSLFKVATQDGTTTGTKPVDTATAAMYIARYPAGNSSSGAADATFASDLYSLQTGVVPYVPDLVNPPHDWTLAINYPVSSTVLAYRGVTNPDFGLAESVAVDANGDIWVTGQTQTSVVRLSPLGVIDPSTAQNFLGYIPGYVSVDGSNNAWTGNANSSTAIFEAGSNGTFTTNYGTSAEFTGAYVNIADGAGDDFFFANAASGYGMYDYPAKSATTATPNYASLSTSGFSANNHVAHGAIDHDGNFWLTSEANTGGATGNYQIAKVNSAGTLQWIFNTGAQQPEYVAIDNSGNGWIPSYEANVVYKISSDGVTRTSLTSGSTSAALVYPFGSAVDGNGNVWITNRCGPGNNCGTYTNSRTLVEINGTGTNGTASKAISPATNFLPQAQYPSNATSFTAIMPDPLNLAIDPSGNIWITNYNNGGTSSVTEIIGTAAPVVTPLSAAAAATPSKLGAKP